ncbi:sugar phosphate isomerase/epimerase family protein [Herbiconiux ginsengi]|uniref:Sugar phosphate isomerase/epimerase n=1 Tax=Herbiconiux ginsengi TaxID=381665 RepID=A0A1H3LKY0_9MICO|nr:sugar phosphate isomerase/epimerase [Herbiconiux ginsengi]SDY65102.1 Sugar phosphate isomerase/epimerase [Herbiconiux ginsengi]
MKVGLDAYTLRESKLDVWELIDWIVAHRLEGMQVSHTLLEDLSTDQIQDLAGCNRNLGLYLELAGPSINPCRGRRTVADVVAEWVELISRAAALGAPLANTSFGLLRERTMQSPALEEQIGLTTEVLRQLAPVGEAHNVAITVELHVDLTSRELVRMVEAVDSRFIGVNLDTANALGLMEDPVEAAERLAPFVRTVHLKDSCVYPAPGGYNWQGGSVLGRGLVDLPTIVDILYAANPDVNLNIEDSGGYLLIPVDDPRFFDSLTELTPQGVMNFNRLLLAGEQLVRTGLQPTPEESDRMLWADVIEGRMHLNAEFARRLRDDVVARHTQDKRNGSEDVA